MYSYTFGEDPAEVEIAHANELFSFGSMRNILHALSGVRRELNIAMVISLILVGFIEFWWRHYPPLFGWKDASRFADVLVNLLLAYAASWIFFFVADHREKREEEAKLKARIDKGILGLFETFIAFADHLGHIMERKPRKKWILTLSDDIVFFDDWEQWAKENDDTTFWIAIDMVLNRRYFDMKEHYFSLKSIGDRLPEGVPLELEDIHNSYVQVLDALADKKRYKKGRYNYRDFGYLFTGIHLHHYHLKNRLVGQGYVPNDPKLRAFLAAGEAHPDLIQG